MLGPLDSVTDQDYPNGAAQQSQPEEMNMFLKEEIKEEEDSEDHDLAWFKFIKKNHIQLQPPLASDTDSDDPNGAAQQSPPKEMNMFL